MVKKLIMILIAHSCDKNDSTCTWQKRVVDAFPPIVKHGEREDGENTVFYADVFDRSRIAEIMGIKRKHTPYVPTGRPRGRPRKEKPRLYKIPELNATIDLDSLKGYDPKSIVWPDVLDPKVIREIEKLIPT